MRVLTISTASKNSPSPAIQDHLTALEACGVSFEHIIVNISNKRSYLSATAKVQQALFRNPPFDIIHAFYGHCGLVARLQPRYPVIVTFQGSDILGGLDGRLHERDGMIGRAVAKVVSSVIVMSDTMKIASGRDDTRVIPFGVNTDIFYPVDKAEARQKLSLDADEKLVLFPYHPDRAEKNFPLAQAAVEMLKAQYDNLRIIPIYARTREEVALYMNACDAFVMVSDHEGSPVALREALMCGLPAISVDVGDAAQYVTAIDGCYLCERTTEDVADKLSNVLAHGQRLEINDLITKLDVRYAADEIFEVYQQTLAKRRRQSGVYPAQPENNGSGSH
ncbi:MAG: glycosyltransferase, partial [Aggregatilineales bacterium]